MGFNYNDALSAFLILFAVIDILGSIPIIVTLRKKVGQVQSEKGKAAIEKQGKFVRLKKGVFETPLVENKECAYVVFGNNGTAQCGIENAHRGNAIDWKKPISCHLYPIRIARYTDFEALNYDRWSICSDACALGEELKVPVYRFLKEPLIRKYGPAFYDELEEVAAHLAGS